MRTPDGAPIRHGRIVLAHLSERTHWRNGEAYLDSTGTFQVQGLLGRDTLYYVSRYYTRVRHPIDLAMGDTLHLDLVTDLRPMFQIPLMLGEPDSSSTRLLWERNAAARAVGLAPLRDTVLPDDTREIRLSNEGSFGARSRFLRLMNRAGEVTGEVITYLHLPTDPGERSYEEAWMAYAEGPRCGPLHTLERDALFDPHSHDYIAAIQACRSTFAEEPDWNAVWEALDAHEVWTLPDDSALPWDSTVTTDGWMLQVELRDGDHYRSYAYANPDGEHPVWPQPRHAAALGTVLSRMVYDKLAPEGGRGRYRGHAFRLPGGLQLFMPCEGGGPWKVQFVRDGALYERLDSEPLLFVETEGVLGVPGRYTRDNVLFGEENVPSGTPVFARWLYAFPTDEPAAEVRTPSPGDCTGS